MISLRSQTPVIALDAGKGRTMSVVVTDFDGLRGMAEASEHEIDRSQPEVMVRFENGQLLAVPTAQLIQRQDGSYFLPFSLAKIGAQGDTSAGELENEETLVVPVVAEQLDVQKRRVETGGVRVKKIVREREEIIDEPLIREEVHVKRVPINRVVEGPVPVRHVGNTMIISLLEEVLVVEKRLMLKEELHITKDEVETYKPQRVVLRSEEATIERVGAPEPSSEGVNNMASRMKG
jgi:uncharacterized protein (TIGR02271 family)